MSDNDYDTILDIETPRDSFMMQGISTPFCNTTVLAKVNPDQVNIYAAQGPLITKPMVNIAPASVIINGLYR